MKKAKRHRVIYLIMEIIFILCALLFLMAFLVCEPHDRIPIGLWLGGCIFMVVEMHVARKAICSSRSSSKDVMSSGDPPPDSSD